MGDNIEGRLGDISGRLGDISGRLGDVSGRLGDISGRASSTDVQDCLMDDREADKLRFIERRLARIESEIILVVRWVNAQLQLKGANSGGDALEQEVSRIKDSVGELTSRVTNIENKLAQAPPSQPTPTPRP